MALIYLKILAFVLNILRNQAQENPQRICGVVLHGDEGDIEIPRNYPPNLNCLWEIRVPKNRILLLTSTYLAIEKSKQCRADYLEIFDGGTTQRFCGYQNFAVFALNNTVYVKFRSDYFFEDGGFMLHFKSVKKGGSNETKGLCNSTITSEVTIENENQQSAMETNIHCFYLIMVPNKVKTVALEVNTSPSSRDEDQQYLKIYDGQSSDSQVLYHAGEMEMPAEIKTTSKLILIEFFCRRYTQINTFRIRVKFVRHSRKLKFIAERKENSGVIKSHGFPKRYPANLQQTTFIRAQNPNSFILLVLLFIDIELSDNCTHDHLTIRDGNRENDRLIACLCGYSRHAQTYISSGSVMRLDMTSNDLISYRGYIGNFTIQQMNIHESVNNDENTSSRRLESTTTLAMLNEDNNHTTGASAVTSFQTLNVKRGQSVMLTCESVDTNITYIWTFNNHFIISNDKIREHSNQSLEIVSFEPKLSGIYACISVSAVTNFNVTFDGSCDTDIQISPSNVKTFRGSNASFYCNISNDADIIWLKNGEVLQTQNKIHNSHILLIENIEKEDEGEYTCKMEGCNIFATSSKLEVYPTNLDDGTCGRFGDVQQRGRISNGKSISQNSAPWHVSLRDKRDGSTFCGGTLLSTSWVLTAAHCVSNEYFQGEFNKTFTKENIQVILGTDWCNGTNSTIRTIKSLLLHPNFGDSAPYDNDIALIEMGEVVVFSNSIRPLCLQSLSSIVDDKSSGRKIGRVVGCGRQHEKDTILPAHINEVFVPFVERKLCAEANIGQGNFTESMFCAGYIRGYLGDACSGDSGSSLSAQMDRDGPWYLVGIVSWGVGCDRPGHFGYYTNVSKFFNWIIYYIGI